MVATSLAQLEEQIRARAKEAMTLAKEMSLYDLRLCVTKFYTGGTPVMYQRTRALGNTPKVSSLSDGGNTIEFEASLDTGHQYTTGANPTMLQVLKLANNGEPFTTPSGASARPTVGRGGFWEEGKQRVEKDLYNSMKRYFK